MLRLLSMGATYESAFADASKICASICRVERVSARLLTFTTESFTAVRLVSYFWHHGFGSLLLDSVFSRERLIFVAQAQLRAPCGFWRCDATEAATPPGAFAAEFRVHQLQVGISCSARWYSFSSFAATC
jgi:hypothetical protein